MIEGALISGCFLAISAPSVRWDGEPVFPDQVAFYALADVGERVSRKRTILDIYGERRINQTRNPVLVGKGAGASVFIPAIWVPHSMMMTYWVSFNDNDTLGYVHPFQMLPNAQRFILPDGGWGYCY